MADSTICSHYLICWFRIPPWYSSSVPVDVLLFTFTSPLISFFRLAFVNSLWEMSRLISLPVKPRFVENERHYVQLNFYEKKEGNILKLYHEKEISNGYLIVSSKNGQLGRCGGLVCIFFVLARDDGQWTMDNGQWTGFTCLQIGGPATTEHCSASTSAGSRAGSGTHLQYTNSTITTQSRKHFSSLFINVYWLW